MASPFFCLAELLQFENKEIKGLLFAERVHQLYVYESSIGRLLVFIMMLCYHQSISSLSIIEEQSVSLDSTKML